MFEYTVSYKKAWKAKQKAIARVYGNWENSYRLLPRWLAAVSHFVPGTIVRYQYKDDDQSAQVANFKRVFWAFKPCIDALPYLKPIVQIDGTFLYGKYRGTLLIATSQDVDTHVVPFAFAIVEGENKEAWSWFLSNIRQHVVKERQNLCLISDRHGGILSAVADERVQWHPPYAHHYWPSAPGPTLEADVGMLREKGRPRSTRIRNEMDWRERGELPLCGLCRNSGHNRATCPERRRQPGGYLTLWTEKDVRQTRVQKTPPYFIYKLGTALSLYGLDILIAYFVHVNVGMIKSPSHLLLLFHTLDSLAFMGECTITLEDVAVQLGLPCTGMVVTGLTEMNWSALCEELLGIIPPPNKLADQRLSLAWLAENFTDLAEDANDTQVQQFAHAYILRLIGGWAGVRDKFNPPDGSLHYYRTILDFMRRNEAGRCGLQSCH
ncbi:uncharacterized protein G2W53_015055 [Senna tora]|uniref:MULE transposase domain-containing protein n=1 Tax=Senna tora TaxID=362788 RepID=A0A834WUS5_9FABA|nr:uncharacterized protein G2W53_015055 [Senna tora]